MTNNKYIRRTQARARQASRRQRLLTEIEKAKKIKLYLFQYIRYVGLVLVQGSSALALVGYPMMTYWIALWFGLVCYQITAVFYYREDSWVYEKTRIKFYKGLGSDSDTVEQLRIKKNREMVYIIGNTIGLILIGSNIILS
jgi:uncharacterized membrane protein